MTDERTIGFNGATVYWSLRDGANLQQLQEGFSTLGLDAAIPEELEDSIAVRRALSKVFPTRRTLVRPMERRGKWAVVQETVGQEELEHEHTLTVEAIRADYGQKTVIVQPYLSEWGRPIQDAFMEEKKTLPSSRLGKSLTTVIASLRGISLRESGGFYWIPQEGLELWKEVGEVVAAAGGGTLYALKTALDNATVSAVCDGLTAQVESEVERLTEEISSGELQKRAIRNRKARARKLDELVSFYSGILGKALNGLTGKVEEINTVVTIAELQLDI